jgi:hypothetical protein
MSSNFQSVLGFGLVLALLQVLAAVPWVAAVLGRNFRKYAFRPDALGLITGLFLGGGVLLAFLIGDTRDSGWLGAYGRLYASVLHAQLILDLFILGFAGLLAFWPRGGSIARAAFLEGVRQPMFWLLTILAVILLVVSMVVPYFTFGDDYKMYKQLGFDVAMLFTVLFGVLATSISIFEEIEGRTAITVMSKPVARRQFLLGKFFGTLAACLFMTLVIGWFFNWTLYIKPYFDRLDDATDPMPKQVQDFLLENFKGLAGGNSEAEGFLKGIFAWTGDTYANGLGLFLGLGQVMVLVAVSTALATRVPMAVNLALCLVVFFLGHLAPELVRVTSGLGVGGNLVSFLAQLFELLMPSLSFFSNSLVVIRDNPLDVWAFGRYVGSVLIYAVGYSTIALLLGLIFFEDRDLA